MNIDEMTIKQARELAGLFAHSATPASPWIVGTNYMIRTVTMTLTGRLAAVGPQELTLECAAWIADTGRFSDALKTGKLDEVEPFPAGSVIVGRGAVVDACVWLHDLPTAQK